MNFFRDWQYIIVKNLIWVVLRLLRVKVIGRANIPGRGSVIIASNHVSFADPPVLGASIKRHTYFMAKAELYSIPVLGMFIKRLKTIPIRRGEHDVTAFKTALRILQRGGVVNLFVEGRRIHTGSLGKAKPGVGMMAARTGACVVPAYLHNTGGTLLKFKRPCVIFGSPIKWNDNLDYQAFADLVMNRIEELKKWAQNETNVSGGGKLWKER